MVRKRRILLISFTFVLVGGGLVHAFDIPGVTRPFDPPDYYSQTAISYPDSTYTLFTMHDLAANGYQVKDVTRGKKNILSDVKLYTSLVNAMQSVQNEIKDLTGLSADHSNAALDFLQNVSAQTNAINQSGAIPDVDAQGIFQTMQTVGDPTKPFDRKTQITWLDHICQTILGAVKDNMTDTTRQTDALMAANNASFAAEGTLAAVQANTEVQGLQSAANLRRNALLSNYVALETTRNMSEKAEQLQSAQDMKNGMAVIISDPYHPTVQEQKQYTRPTGIGFVNFQ